MAVVDIITDDFSTPVGTSLGASWPSSDGAEVAGGVAFVKKSGGTILYVTSRHADTLSSPDYVVSLDINVTGQSSSNARSGLVFGSQGSSYFLCTYNPGNGYVTFAKVVDGSYTNVNNRIWTTLAGGSTFTLRVTSDGDLITIEALDVNTPGNDLTPWTYTIVDEEFATATDVGIRLQSQSNATCAVDNFAAAILAAPPTSIPVAFIPTTASSTAAELAASTSPAAGLVPTTASSTTGELGATSSSTAGIVPTTAGNAAGLVDVHTGPTTGRSTIVATTAAHLAGLAAARTFPAAGLVPTTASSTAAELPTAGSHAAGLISTTSSSTAPPLAAVGPPGAPAAGIVATTASSTALQLGATSTAAAGLISTTSASTAPPLGARGPDSTPAAGIVPTTSSSTTAELGATSSSAAGIVATSSASTAGTIAAVGPVIVPAAGIVATTSASIAGELDASSLAAAGLTSTTSAATATPVASSSRSAAGIVATTATHTVAVVGVAGVPLAPMIGTSSANYAGLIDVRVGPQTGPPATDVADLERIVSAWLRADAEVLEVLPAELIVTATPKTGPPAAPWMRLERISPSSLDLDPVAEAHAGLIFDAGTLQFSVWGGSKALAWTIANTVRRRVGAIALEGIGPGGHVLTADPVNARYDADVAVSPMRPRVLFDVTLTTKPNN